MRERPYINLKGRELIEMFDEKSDDLNLICDVAYEVLFRKYVCKEDKVRVIERLISFCKQQPDFPFPTTDIVQTRRDIRGKLGNPDWSDVGLLKHSGYEVGETYGKPEAERRRILNYLFLKDDLEDVDDKSYVAEWGEKKTFSRLKKMAECIAAFTRNAKHNSYDYIEAIHDWESDLSYLKVTFYDGWHNFPWPNLDK